MTKDVEAILAKHTVQRAVVVGPVVIATLGLVRGVGGAAAAAIGIAIVVGNFLASGLMLSAALRISPAFYHGTALFGFLLRLGAITAMMALVAGLFDIDRLALGLSTVIGYLVLLTLEAAAVARGKERDLEWTG
jgi:hypothetical protein